MAISKINLNNITFERTGNLFSFKMYMVNSVIISDSNFTNLYGARFNIEPLMSYNNQKSIHVELHNIYAYN